MAVSISAFFFGDLREHLRDHGFHWDWSSESHTIDAVTLDQSFTAHIHTAEECGGAVDVRITLDWPADDHLELRDWAHCAEPGDPVPAEFAVILCFEVCLPPLTSPPDPLTMWMDVLGLLNGGPLKVDVSASDRLETPTDHARRTMSVTAEATIPLCELFTYDPADMPKTDDHDGDPDPLCRVFDDLHGLCSALAVQVGQWK